MFGDGPGLSCAADHAKKRERAMNPGFEHQRVVFVTARDDEAKSGLGRKGRGAEFAPVAGAEENVAREKVVVRQFGAVVKNSDGEIQLQRERRDGLRDVA